MSWICSLCSSENSDEILSCKRCGKKFTGKTSIGKTIRRSAISISRSPKTNTMPSREEISNSLYHPTEKNIPISYEPAEKKISTSPRLKTVLVVEDSSILRLMIQVILNVQGYRVIEAVDGINGVNKAIEEQPDIILMDILLPSLNGIEAVKRLKQNTRTSAIPVLAISCLDTKKQVMGALEAGCDDYLKKPFNPESLLEKVTKLTSGKKQSII